jgi:hypothetical protein
LSRKIIHIVLFSVLFVFMVPAELCAQRDTFLVDPAWTGKSWESFVELAERKLGVVFYFDPDGFNQDVLPKIEAPMSLSGFLDVWLEPIGLVFSLSEKGELFITKQNPVVTGFSRNIYPEIRKSVAGRDQEIETRGEFVETKKEHLARVLVVGNKQDGFRSRKAKLSGFIRDQKDSSALFGATVMIEETGVGAAADENGYYELTISKGSYTLLVREINHRESRIRLELLSDGRADLYLESTSVTLESVVVTSDRYDRVQNNRMGYEQLSTKSIKEIPLVLGEKDILKVATLLPGIQSVGEGAAGFNVRGSPADQNLFYIDKVPVYNTSHLFGFFSVFNSDAISEFSLSKSNIPVRFGGRLASIFDIRAREGDKEQVKLRGGISPITGNLLLEGPIQKERSSFLLGVRSTYSNWILKLIPNPDFNRSRVYFGDAMVKFDFNLNPKNKIQAFGYYSLDDIYFAGNTQYNIGNQGASVSWKRFFNEKNNLDLSLIYSKYGLESENFELPAEAYRQNNVLIHKESRLDFNFRPDPKHELTLGANAILYDLDRGEFGPVGEESNIVFRDLGTERGLEYGLYLGETWSPTARLAIIGGLRFNGYAFLGPQTVFLYNQGQLKEEGSIADTLSFGQNEWIRHYTGWDYRLAAKYNFNPSWAWKASYNKLHQYIFLLSNTIALAPTDKWKLSDYHIEPMVGQQVTMGIYTYLWSRRYEFSLEGYYKKVDKLVEFRDGADLLINEVPEWDVLQGELDVYGLELMLKKSSGRFNGWLNYTYSRARVLVDGPEEGAAINFGDPYPANHDKPHSLNLVLNYQFLRRLSFSGNLVYSTGKPITYPTHAYYQDGIHLVNFTGRNEYRTSDYFRVDLSVKVEGNLKAEKFMHGVWVFSLYNLTGRNNVYNEYFKARGGTVRGYRVSVFANPVFSVSYNFKFGNYDY